MAAALLLLPLYVREQSAIMLSREPPFQAGARALPLRADVMLMPGGEGLYTVPKQQARLPVRERDVVSCARSHACYTASRSCSLFRTTRTKSPTAARSAPTPPSS